MTTAIAVIRQTYTL